MIKFENKLVAVLNKSIEPGVAMNALAHMNVGIGANIDKEQLRLDTYVDADGTQFPNISQLPYIVLKAGNNKIREAVAKAREENIRFGAFIHTMTGGTYVEQLANTKATNEEALTYYGVVLFGEVDKVTEMTKKFSLWKQKDNYGEHLCSLGI